MASDDDTAVIVACTSIIASFGFVATISIVLQQKKRKHDVWISRYLQLRYQFGTYNTLLPELSNSPKFYAYLRMDVDMFEQLFQMIQTVSGSVSGSSVRSGQVVSQIPLI